MLIKLMFCVDGAGNMCTAVRGKKRKSRSDVFKQRFRKNFSALLEEEVRVRCSEKVIVNIYVKMNSVSLCESS